MCVPHWCNIHQSNVRSLTVNSKKMITKGTTAGFSGEYHENSKEVFAEDAKCVLFFFK